MIDVSKIIAWAAELAEQYEKATNRGLSTTQVLLLHRDEKKKLVMSGTTNDEANEIAKEEVEKILLEGVKNEK